MAQRNLLSAVAALAFLAGACGCSQQGNQKTLTRRLSDADRVMVLNAYDGTATSMRDEHVRKLVHALETARKVTGGEPGATPGYTLVFFKAGVHLATVPTGADVIFYIDNTPYEDKSGALRALSEKFRETHSSSTSAKSSL